MIRVRPDRWSVGPRTNERDDSPGWRAELPTVRARKAR